MFKEWKAIFKKPTFIIVMIGISLIPALYNIIFLSSMWDPYGNLSELPVAVVNKDQSSTYNGTKMTIGEDMVSNLKESKNLDFHFVDEKEGEKGLTDGDYYMVVTLPSDLSEKAASILSNHPEQMKIDYQTSSGHSFIASKMSDSAMTQLKQTVATNVTQTYTKALFEKMSELNTGINQAADASVQLSNGSGKLVSGSQTLTSNLKTLEQSSLVFSDGAKELSRGLTAYTDGVKQLDFGLTTFNGGLNDYTTGISQVNNGLEQLSVKTPDLIVGINQLNTGVQAYTGGVSQLHSGLNQFSNGVNTYTNGVEKLSSGANQLSTQSETLRNGMSQLNQGVQQLSSQLSSSTQKKDQLTQLSASIEELNKEIQSSDVANTAQFSESLSTVASSAQTIINSSQSERDSIVASIQSTSAYQSLSNQQKSEIISSVSNHSNSNLQSAKTILSTVQKLQENLDTVTNKLDNINNLKASSNKLLPATSTTLTGLSSGLTQIQTTVDEKLLPASQSISSGVDTYTKSVDQVANSASQLNSSNSKLTGSLEQLLSGSNQLSQKSTELTSGTTKLSEKAPEFATGITKLSSGVNQLANKTPELTSGFETIKSGSNQLTEKSNQLISGTSQLASGSTKIAVGAGELAQGGEKLTSGLESVYTGTNQLSDGLSTAGEQLQTASTNTENAEILSDPLTLSKTDRDQVSVNGIGMAPYMISVALFVAAISTNVIFAKLPSGRHPENRWSWFKSRSEINGIIAILAGILVYAGVHLIGLTATHELKTLVLIILTSCAFMAMVTALVTWNSRVGAFFSLILLLLQLASSAGTYPLSLTNDFFKAVNPWLPMSYSVSGLRQTISMTGTIHSQIVVLVSTVCIFIALGMLVYQPKKAEED